MSLEQARRRRQAIETIHDVVSAMRAIAAGRIRGAQDVLAAARRYHAVVIEGLAALLDDPDPGPAPPDRGPATLLVMTSEQPLCGSFNVDLLALAERRWRELRGRGEVHLLVVGHRGARQLATRGIAPDGIERGATTLDGLVVLVKRLSELLDRRLALGTLGTLRVLYNRFQSISEQVPAELVVLPLDLDLVRRPPLDRARRLDRYLSRPELLAGLIDEYAFISLFLLAAESYAGEQSSRLVATDASTRNTQRMIERLTDLEQRERQGEVTREVLDLLAARIHQDR